MNLEMLERRAEKDRRRWEEKKLQNKILRRQTKRMSTLNINHGAGKALEEEEDTSNRMKKCVLQAI